MRLGGIHRVLGLVSAASPCSIVACSISLGLRDCLLGLSGKANVLAALVHIGIEDPIRIIGVVGCVLIHNHR
jgi:hypothetical protein